MRRNFARHIANLPDARWVRRALKWQPVGRPDPGRRCSMWRTCLDNFARFRRWANWETAAMNNNMWNDAAHSELTLDSLLLSSPSPQAATPSHRCAQCRCRVAHDALGDHIAAFPRSGVLSLIDAGTVADTVWLLGWGNRSLVGHVHTDTTLYQHRHFASAFRSRLCASNPYTPYAAPNCRTSASNTLRPSSRT